MLNLNLTEVALAALCLLSLVLYILNVRKSMKLSELEAERDQLLGQLERQSLDNILDDLAQQAKGAEDEYDNIKANFRGDDGGNA